MDSSRERRLFAWFDGFASWTAAIDVVLLIPLYVVIYSFMPAQGFWGAIRELALGILLNLIPVLLVAVGSYLLLRQYQRLKSEHQSNELADQVVAALSPEVSHVTADVVAALAPELSKLAAAMSSRTLPASGMEVVVPEGKLVVTSARYGTDDAIADVTAILASKVSGERLELKERYSSLFPDPAKHEHKKLMIIYIYAGTEISITVPEDTSLVLPLPLSWAVKQVEVGSSNIVTAAQGTSATTVLLRACNGRYVFTLGGRGTPAEVFTRERVEDRDALQWIDLGQGKVALRTRSGYYLCAENGGGGQVNANRDKPDPGAWETFVTKDLRDNRVAFQTHEGFYLRVQNDERGTVVADRKEIGEQETFEVIKG